MGFELNIYLDALYVRMNDFEVVIGVSSVRTGQEFLLSLVASYWIDVDSVSPPPIGGTGVEGI
jgi:hypothetical protein